MAEVTPSGCQVGKRWGWVEARDQSGDLSRIQAKDDSVSDQGSSSRPGGVLETES